MLRALIASGAVLVALVVKPLQLEAQDDHAFHHHHVAVFVGATTPFNSASGGKTGFTIGADYEYRFTESVGAMLLFDHVMGDHKRDWLFGAMFAVRPIDALRLAIGVGFELADKDVASGGMTVTQTKAYFVWPTRVSYDFHAGNFTISPTLGIDLIGETKTNIVYGLAFGYGF